MNSSVPLCVCVCIRYVHAHINLYACSCVCACQWVSFFTSVCVSTYSDYQSSAVCLTTGAVSFDCIDSVLLHAVMKDEKWTACSEYEVIGLHLVCHGSQGAEAEGDRGRKMGGDWNFTCAQLFVCISVCVGMCENLCLLDDRLLSIQSCSAVWCSYLCDVSGKIVSTNKTKKSESRSLIAHVLVLCHNTLLQMISHPQQYVQAMYAQLPVC